jgi:hypothetical protein
MTTTAYEWRCGCCCATNTEQDELCWYCNSSFLDGAAIVSDNEHVPRAMWRDVDVIAEVAAEIAAVYHRHGLAAARRIVERLSEAYGEYLVKANRRPKQRTGRLCQ